MADNQKTADEQPNDLLDTSFASDDPQAAMMARGWGQTAKLAGDHIAANLDAQHQMLTAAMAGDQAAQLAVAANSLGAAMGTIQPLNELSNGLGATQRIAQEVGQPVNTAAQLESGIAAAGRPMTMREMQLATQKKGFEQIKRTPESYADGGEVDTQPGISQDNTQLSMPQQGDIKVISPEGDFGSIPSHQLEDALASGFRQPTPEEVSKNTQLQKYGSGLEQAKTFAESAAKGVAGPLAPMAEEALGANPEDIRGRAETNPGLATTGEIAGLGASLATGFGEGALAARAAELALPTISGASLGAKIGSSAVKAAIENALISGSDEVSKMVVQDPNQSLQTAVVDVGLSGVLGGALGGSIGGGSELWKATVGPKLTSLLDTITKRAGGIEGITPEPMSEAITQSGLHVDPEIRAALSQDPSLAQSFQTLQESSTASGLKAQKALKTFKDASGDALVSSLGRAPEEVANLAHMSDYEAGQELKFELAAAVKEKLEPISAQFESIKKRYAEEPLPPMSTDDLGTRIGELADKEGYNLSPSSPQAKVIQDTLSELPNLSTLEDLRKYQSILGDKTYSNPELRRVGGQIKGILRELEDETITSAAGRAAPEAIGEHADARAGYRSAMTLLDTLNDRLHVGRYAGPSSFIKALNEMQPEDILRRLNPKGDASLIHDLTAQFPTVAEKVKEHQINQLLKVAGSKAESGSTINSKVLFGGIDKLSPEMKAFILPDSQKFDAIRTMLEGLPSRMNTSGTAKAIDSLWSKVPGSAMAMVSMITGHNPAIGYVLGSLGKHVARDTPDAIKLATLKFMGSAKPIESESFKATVDYLHNVIKGEDRITKAVKAVFVPGREVLGQAHIPDERSTTKLDKQLKALQLDQTQLLDMNGKLGHYMPEHAAASGQTAMQAVNYLNSLRPNTTRQSPLDSIPVPNSVEIAKFNNALKLAQQPLIVLDKIKQGTITPADITGLQTMYPALHNKLVNQLVSQMTHSLDKEHQIPYKTRIGMSMFMGQPLDSTMTPAIIISAQPTPQQPPSQPGQQAPKTPGQKNKLDKLPKMYETPLQSRAEHKLKQ